MHVNEYYTTKENKIKRQRQFCPKCGSGVFLAEHADRMTCGKCGYTKYKKNKKG
jgi:small subunit ribosomal protein S27Ae